MPVKCHIGDAMVVNKRPSNDKAVEKLVGMEEDVNFAREESLGYSERRINFVDADFGICEDFLRT